MIRHHTIKTRYMLDEATQHARGDVGKVKNSPKAEVLQGLITAYAHYEEKSEEAWR